MMMATGYSTLFSLGLSNIHISFPRDPDATTTSSLGLSATPSTPSSPVVLPKKIHIDTQIQAPSRPQHRRRRSSITAAQSPLGNIGVKKNPAQTARVSAVSPARTRHRRSESDAIQRLRSNNVGDAVRSLRGPVRTPPPDMPLPAVPTIPADYASATAKAAKKRASSSVRPPSDSAAYHRRTYLSDKDSAINSSLSGRSSLVLPTSAASSGSHWSSQFMLTPGFTSRVALAMNTPPGSDLPSPNPMQSPVDPILGNSYFETRPLITGQETNQN